MNDVHASIDSRLDQLRAELSTLMPPPSPRPQRPSLAPAPEPPRSKDGATLLYMPSFFTQQIRTARKAARTGRSVRDNPRKVLQPGARPIGYRIQTAHPSTPAYTMRKKIVLSANLDPDLPDDNPGPGAYDLLKY